MTRTRPYTWTEVEKAFTVKAARNVTRRYAPYGVTFDDAQQEILVWLYGKGKAKVERWLANEPQQTTRIFRSMIDAAAQYGEREKATRCGYDVEDVEWYTPRMIEGLMPLALDPTFDGTPAKQGDGHRTSGGGLISQGNEALVAVLDIRRALKACPSWVTEMFQLHEPGAAGWDDAVYAVINRLGGDLGRVGRRRVLSNAHAQHITGSDYE